jgi:hypothetical protein
MSVAVDRQDRFLTDMFSLYIEAHRLGFKVTLGEGWRPQLTQDHYLATGKSKAPHSKHQDRLAIDFEFFLDGKWINGLPAKEAVKILAPLGKFWEDLRIGNRWGGNFDHDWSKEDNFKDACHFESN